MRKITLSFHVMDYEPFRRGWKHLGIAGPLTWKLVLMSADTKEKVADDYRPPLSSVTTALPRLRQVVAERGEPHVLDRLGRDGRASRQGRVRRQAVAYPRGPNQVRVLHSDLQTAFGTVVGLVPEASGAFDHALVLADAASQRSGTVTVRCRG